MKHVICITKTAEIEVGIQEAIKILEDEGHDVTGWTDEVILEEYAELLDAQGVIEYDGIIVPVTQYREAA